MVWADRLERTLEEKSQNKIEVPWGLYKAITIKDKIHFMNNLRFVFKSKKKYDFEEITNNILDN